MAAPGAAGVGAGSVTRVLWCRADGAGSRLDRGTAEGKVSAWEDGVVPVSVVVTSDTHVPRRARDLPHALWAAIDASDVVVHAGDWVDVALLDRLEARSRRVIAAYGNKDHRPLPERRPQVGPPRIPGPPRPPPPPAR